MLKPNPGTGGVPAAAGRSGAGRMLDVTVVLLDDGLSSTALTPVEIFHSAGALWNDLHGEPAKPAFRVTTASIDGGPVRSPYGLSIAPQTSIDRIERSDVVVVPTSGLDLDPVIGSPLLPWLRRQYERGAYVAGVCMGAAYLAEAGLLDGRTATTHWAVCGRLAERWPQVNWRPDLFVTEDGRALCSGGVYASIDLSLHLVEKLCGHETAVQTARALLLPLPRTHQSAYAVLPVSRPHGDVRIRAVEAFVHSNYRHDISTQELAERAGLSPRTFGRHFKAATGRMPAAYLQAVRIEAAKAMLERDSLPVQQVSSAVGYDDVAFFRALFKRNTGMTPAEYRASFAPMAVRGVAEAAMA